MLSLSNISVVETLRQFKAVGLPVGFLVPTKTGLEKSIMDATKSLRDFFVAQGIHDYDLQDQGTQSKALIRTILLSKDEVIETKTSFYRPETKSGDPRIWVYRLAEFAESGDLLAIVGNADRLVVVNCTKSNLTSMLDQNSPRFSEFFLANILVLSTFATELLELMRGIAGKGYVRTLRLGDTGVGYTLETLLGISANSSKFPDYKGIEIKSGRKRSQKSGRTTIFSQVPNWQISRLKGSKEILFERGRFHVAKKRMQLFHEFSTIKLNSYNMKLDLDLDHDLLHQICVEDGVEVRDVTWELPTLKRRVSEKHKETFWVAAISRGKSGDIDEEFLYSEIKHTGGVDPSVFPTLLETGVVTLDYTIKESKPGVAKDQGYLFKMSSRDLDLLFSRVDYYSLI